MIVSSLGENVWQRISIGKRPQYGSLASVNQFFFLYGVVLSNAHFWAKLAVHHRWALFNYCPRFTKWWKQSSSCGNLYLGHSNGMLGMSYIQCNFIAKGICIRGVHIRCANKYLTAKEASDRFLAVSFSPRYFQSFNSWNYPASFTRHRHAWGWLGVSVFLH